MTNKGSGGKPPPGGGHYGHSGDGGGGGGSGSGGKSMTPPAGQMPYGRSGDGGGGGGSGGKSTPPGGTVPLRLSGDGGGGDGSDGKYTPPMGGPGPLRRSGKGGGGDVGDGMYTPPMGGPGPLRRSGKGGGGDVGDGMYTPPMGGPGPLRRSGKGGGGSGSAGGSSSGTRPRPGPTVTTFQAIMENAIKKIESKRKKTVDGSSDTLVETSPVTTEQNQAVHHSVEQTGQPQQLIDSAPSAADYKTASHSAEQKDKSTNSAPLQYSGSPAPTPNQSRQSKRQSRRRNKRSAQPASVVAETQSTRQSRRSKRSAQPASVVADTQSTRRSPRNKWSAKPASVVNQAPTRRDNLKAQFLDFLENHREKKTLKGECLGYYEAQVKVMALCEQYTLKVKFKDLLKDMKYAELAMEIANDRDRGHQWLQEVARDFMMRSFKEQDRKKLRLSFSKKPQSMKRLDSIPLKELVRKVNIVHAKDKVPAPTSFGRHVYLAVLLHILDNHDEGISWSGLFEPEDIYILVYQDSLQCWIAKETGLEDKQDISYLDRCSTAQRVLDLHKVDSVLTDKYKDGETLPLYFDQLREDLQNLGPNFLDDHPWFIIYLRFHVALMSSMARKFLISELFHLMCTYKLLSDTGNKNESSAFTRRFQWITDLWSKNNPLLVAVYKHDNPIYDEENPKKGKAGKSNSTQRNADKNEVTKGKAGDSNTPEAKVDRYSELLGSALSYKRHLISHTHHNIDNAKLQKDFDGIELFAAWSLPKVLPSLIQLLLDENNMTGRFAILWSAFCSMRSDNLA